jgi:hypothetical protein
LAGRRRSPTAGDEGVIVWIDQRGSEVLDRNECQRLLALRAGGIGRFGLSAAGQVVIVPVNYQMIGQDVLIRVGPGDVLEAAPVPVMVARAPSARSIGCYDRVGATPSSSTSAPRIVPCCAPSGGLSACRGRGCSKVARANETLPIANAGFTSVDLNGYRVHSPVLPFNTHVAGIATKET